MRLDGEKVSIRPITRDDLPFMHRWCNDPEVMYYADDNPEPHKTEADVEEQYRRETEEWSDSMRRFTVEAIGGDPIGTIMYRALRRDTRSAWMGITIGEKSFWGRGCGTEAIRLFLKYLFKEMKLHKVAITVSDFNKRAIRAYEKNGFRHDGVLRHNACINGAFVDHLVMSILEDEYSPEEC